MSRKPDTPTDDAGPAGSGQQFADIPVGRRFSSNDELLRIERDLLAEGVDLSNRAIPSEVHKSNGYESAAAIRERIEAEADREHPNKQTIAYLNELLREGEHG